jgi:hypothetical protein
MDQKPRIHVFAFEMETKIDNLYILRQFLLEFELDRSLNNAGIV